MPANVCVACVRRPATVGVLCAGDAKAVREQLTQLPGKLALLELQFVPGSGQVGEWVATAPSGSRPPLRLDALSLAATGGSVVPTVDMLQPAVRSWQSRHTVLVTTTIRPCEVVTEEREISVWHRAAVRGPDGQPLMVLADDQVGAPPPRVWLDDTVRRWRRALGHHVPARTIRAKPTWSPALDREAAAMLVARSVTVARFAAFAVVLGRAWRQHMANEVTGLAPGRGGHRPVHERLDDPVAYLWRSRYREHVDQAVVWDVRYLLTWLDEACERDLGIAGMVRDLRALTAELTRVLGEKPDQQWLGRCPAMLTDRATGSEQVCSAGLWQDPHASQVQCPRCRSTWGPGPSEVLLLAREIRRKHPLDRRRRYHREDIDAMAATACPGCGGRVEVRWRDVTASRDDRRWWRPVKVTCGKGCQEAGGLL